VGKRKAEGSRWLEPTGEWAEHSAAGAETRELSEYLGRAVEVLRTTHPMFHFYN
jgi:hypothetical protein